MINYDQKLDRGACAPQLSMSRAESLIQQSVADLVPMSGGFSNANYRLRINRGLTCVLRIARDPDALLKEIAVLNLISREVPAPSVIGSGNDGEYAWALLTIISGHPMDQVMTAPASPTDWRLLGRSCGRTLAAIHGFSFEQSGFLDGDLRITSPLEPVGRAYLDHIQDTLATPLPRARLGEAAATAVELLLAERGALLDSLAHTRCLVHSDFNTKNLMVSRSGLTGVLDWEFAHAGPALTDLANFLRYEEEAPPGLVDGFLGGYAAAGGELTEGWREQALLLDLASMVSFLDSRDERPRTFETARTVIVRTLERLSARLY